MSDYFMVTVQVKKIIYRSDEFYAEKAAAELAEVIKETFHCTESNVQVRIIDGI